MLQVHSREGSCKERDRLGENHAIFLQEPSPKHYGVLRFQRRLVASLNVLQIVESRCVCQIKASVLNEPFHPVLVQNAVCTIVPHQLECLRREHLTSCHVAVAERTIEQKQS